MVSPVKGFLPRRADLWITENRPNPENKMESSWASRFVISSKRALMVFSVLDLDVLSLLANSSINSFLSIKFFLKDWGEGMSLQFFFVFCQCDVCLSFYIVHEENRILKCLF